MVIRSSRLDLEAMTLPTAALILSGGRPSEARWALGYPTDRTLMAASMVVAAESEGHDVGTFGSYQVVHRESALVVGDCGFEGPPDTDGNVHVSFTICASQRRRGYAREAVQALMRWALDQDGVEHVLADTTPANVAAIRVLETAGMRRHHVDESLVYYRA